MRGIRGVRGGNRVAYHIVRGKVQHDGYTTVAGYGEHDGCGPLADEWRVAAGVTHHMFCSANAASR
jgi:hypothetical protein